jgi:hypothetical protein
MADEPTGEIRTEPLSPVTVAVLALVQGLLPAMTAIVGGLWIAFTYVEHQKEARIEASDNAQKAFVESVRQSNLSHEIASKEMRYKLFDIYKPTLDARDSDHFALAHTVAVLLSHDVSTDEWNAAYTKFWESYWDVGVSNLDRLRDKATKFGESLKKYKASQDAASRADFEATGKQLVGEVVYWIGEQKFTFLKGILTAPTDNDAINNSSANNDSRM